MGSGADNYAKGHAFEREIAELFLRNGYSAELNVVRPGRSGASHEIDVLAHRSDSLTAALTLVECKAHSGPVSKEVVAKTSLVMRDVGVHHGIVVALEGWTTGAEDTARESGIELWGPDELASRLGRSALAGLRNAPVREAQGFEQTVDVEAGLRFVERESRGFLGFGKGTHLALGTLWTPWHLLQIGISYTKGTLRKRTVSRRVWNMYDALAGNGLIALPGPPDLAVVDIGTASLPVETTARKIVSEINTSLSRYREVTTEAARERHARRLAARGVELPVSAVQIEEQSTVYLPMITAVVRERSGERVIAVHANGRASVDREIGGELTGRLASVLNALQSAQPPPPPPAPGRDRS